MESILEREREALRKKAEQKLESVFSLKDSVVPDSVVVEQASSYMTASYMASLLPPGKIIADLTAGLGVNTVLFSMFSERVYAIEIDSRRAEALEINLRLAGISNVEVIGTDCVEWLNNFSIDFDYGFVDPSRRDMTKRVVSLRQCSPDIFDILDVLRKRESSKRPLRLFVKTSPLLDITSVVENLPELREIHIVEANREVKELLLVLDTMNLSDIDRVPEIICVRIANGILIDSERFNYSEYGNCSYLDFLSCANDIVPDAFLYEPSPAYMKSRMFGSLVEKFPSLKKLSQDTHLFFSTIKYENFPGRIFQIEGTAGSSELKKLRGTSFNVISRNHPAKASELERKFRLKPSERDFLIACRVGKDKCIIKVKRQK